MSTKIASILIWTLIIASVVIGVFVYPALPERIASHWNTHGQVDGYMPKFWGVFLLPIVIAVMYLFFMLIPKIDPLRKNIEAFRSQYNALIFLISLFLFYISTLSIVWNLGIHFDMTRAILPSIGLLIFYLGVLIRHAKRNWFVGIRTPWTLSSDEVWRKTHNVGSALFKAAGFIAILSYFMPDLALYLVMIPIFVTVLFLIIYSYVLYQKELENKTQNDL